jgi:hypothetical protein
MQGDFHGHKKEMVRAGNEAQRCDGPEEKCVQTIGPEEDRAIGEEIGGAEHAEKIDAETLGDVDAFVLRQPGGEKSFPGRKEEAAAGEEGAAEVAGLIS